MTMNQKATPPAMTDPDIDAELEREIARRDRMQADLAAGRLVPRSALAAIFAHAAAVLRQGISRAPTQPDHNPMSGDDNATD